MATETESAAAADDEPVPKLPRGRGFKFSGPEMFRIALTVMTLAGVILLTRPCANAVSNFVMGMDGSASGSAGAAKQMPKPGTVDQPGVQPRAEPEYEQLKPGMSEAEIKAAIERSKARAAGSSGGSAATGSAAPSP